MPAKKEVKPVKENSEKKYLEFNDKFGDGNQLKINLSGRIYPAKENNGIKRSYVSLNVDGLFDISNCSFVETSNNYFLAFPQQTIEKDGKKEYKPYIYVAKDSFFASCLDQLCEVLLELSKKF